MEIVAQLAQKEPFNVMLGTGLSDAVREVFQESASRLIVRQRAFRETVIGDDCPFILIPRDGSIKGLHEGIAEFLCRIVDSVDYFLGELLHPFSVEDLPNLTLHFLFLLYFIPQKIGKEEYIPSFSI